MTDLAAEIDELLAIHKGMKRTTPKNRETVLSGPLPFEAEPDGLAPITDSFEIEVLIPDAYPDILPRVTETGGKMEPNYEHVFTDGTLCLAIPIEMREIFDQQPSLLGFVNRLVIPYFYGYCHWREYGQHPFGEQKHGGEGIVQYYVESLNLTNEVTALAFLCLLYEHGYRGHHNCPCGSARRLRKCHGPKLFDLYRHHTAITLRNDLVWTLDYCTNNLQNGHWPDKLTRQILRILERDKRKYFNSSSFRLRDS